VRVRGSLALARVNAGVAASSGVARQAFRKLRREVIVIYSL
jgi:hypothetical protein